MIIDVAHFCLLDDNVDTQTCNEMLAITILLKVHTHPNVKTLFKMIISNTAQMHIDFTDEHTEMNLKEMHPGPISMQIYSTKKNVADKMNTASEYLKKRHCIAH